MQQALSDSTYRVRGTPRPAAADAVAVKLTIKNYRCFPDENPARLIIRPGFTALVGANNAGKSSLLRFFYEFRTVFRMLAGPDEMRRSSHSISGLDLPREVQDSESLFSNRNRRGMSIEVELLGPQPEGPGPLLATAVAVELQRDPVHYRVTVRAGGKWLSQLAQVHDGVVAEAPASAAIDLRPLCGALADLAQTLYVPPFRNAINVGGGKYFDIETGSGFIEAWDRIKNGYQKRDALAAVQLQEDVRRIFGYESLEINAAADNSTINLVADGKPYDLAEVGAGMAQFVIVLVNAAISKPRYVLIDEPETSLHPALQLLFLTALGEHAQLGVVFSTHSMGLAISGADISYSVRRTGEGESQVAPLESMKGATLSEMLGELSFSSFRDVGFDRLLLVEGPADVKPIQGFLRRLGKGREVVLFPLGGGSLIGAHAEAELQELKRISPKISAVIDSERANPKGQLDAGRIDFVAACRRAGIKVHVLELRAFENYLTDTAVKAEFGDKYRALGPYEALKETPYSWGKADNWRIARHMTLEDLVASDLGKFLKGI